MITPSAVPDWAARLMTRLNAKEDLPEALLQLFARSQPDVCFMQIGSNDGITRDPLHAFVTELGWRGVAVEPVPENFLRLQATYASFKSVTCLQAAISTETCTRTFYYCKRGAGMPSWVDQIGSFDRDHVLKHALFDRNIERHLEELQVQCMTLRELFRVSKLERVDVLHTDAEGHDYQILKQIDFVSVRPKVLLFEDVHMADAEREAAAQLLRSHGYGLVHGFDTLAYLL